MKKFGLLSGILVFLALTVGVLWGSQRTVEASPLSLQNDSIPRGAALYDNWYAALEVEPPAGNMPLWSRQQTNTSSGPDTWRCITCHGWDYQGKDGAYGSGSHYTGFPGIYAAAQTMTADEIIAHLKGENDPAHDYSALLDEANLRDLATFIKQGLVDDNQYIDLQTLAVKQGDAAHGQTLYDQQCASCHGSDGAKIEFRFEGITAHLGTLATLDPWRFLHKTRFGTPGTPMVIGYDLGWTAQDGRDVLLYAQGLPSGLERPSEVPSMSERPQEQEGQPGGPAQNWITGVLTALGAMATSLGFAVLLGAALVGIILLLVWFIRGRR